MARGRPAKYTNCMDLAAMIECYFEFCDAGEDVEQINKRGDVVKFHRQIPYTVEDLSDYLGFADRHSLTDYAKRSPDPNFAHVISRARQRIYSSWIKGSMTGQINERIAGLALMTHAGYSTKAEIEAQISDETTERTPEELDMLRRQALERSEYRRRQAAESKD